MERYQKISSKIIIALAVIWIFLPLDLGYRYMFFGAIVTYMGIQNFILILWGKRTGQMPSKIQHLVNKHGTDKAELIFGLFFILFFLLMGIGVVYSGYQIQFPA